jgi:hypothetical protein
VLLAKCAALNCRKKNDRHSHKNALILVSSIIAVISIRLMRVFDVPAVFHLHLRVISVFIRIDILIIVHTILVTSVISLRNIEQTKNSDDRPKDKKNVFQEPTASLSIRVLLRSLSKSSAIYCNEGRRVANIIFLKI